MLAQHGNVHQTLVSVSAHTPVAYEGLDVLAATVIGPSSALVAAGENTDTTIRPVPSQRAEGGSRRSPPAPRSDSMA
jgi:hypothetical protein